MKDSDGSISEKRFPVLLRSAWFGLNKSFRRRLVEYDLTPVQFIALRWLLENHPDGLSQRELARLTASNANNVTDLVVRMEQQGLLTRTVQKKDARVKMLVLTPKGRRIYDGARRTAVALQKEVLSGLEHEERETFLALLDRVASGLDVLAAETQSSSKTGS